MKKKDDIVAGVITGLMLLGVLLAVFAVNYAWLNLTPCNFHSVKDAPVRCVNEPTYK